MLTQTFRAKFENPSKTYPPKTRANPPDPDSRLHYSAFFHFPFTFSPFLSLQSNPVRVLLKENMHGRLACRLVKEIANGEKGQLKPFNEELLNEVAKECSENFLVLQSLIRKMQEEGLDFQTTRNADHYGALINHLSLIRNKRCLMAYVYNRAEVIQNLAWKVGLRLFELPEEIQEKLSHSEKEYFKRHSAALESYMSKVDLDLNVDMVPPKDPYIKVRVLDDVGEGIVVSDKAANFARHSMHFLKRTDAEPYISRGLMEELTG